MNPDTLFIAVYILIAVFLLMLPYLVFPTLPFGVRVPMANTHDPAVLLERRRYALFLGILAIGLLLVDLALWSLVARQTLLRLSIIGLVLGGWAVYYVSTCAWGR
jgi:hypothetical protein